jgi:hypothetical protein
MNTMEKFCPDVLTLAGWIEGTLSPDDRSRTAAHLAACDDCRRAVALSSTLEAPPAEAPVNEILLSKVVASSRRRRVVPFAAAAAAVLAVAVGFAVFPRNTPPPAPTYTIDTKNVQPPEDPKVAVVTTTPEAPKLPVAPKPDPSTLPLLPEEKPGLVKKTDPPVPPLPTEEVKKPVSPTVVEPTPVPPAVVPPPVLAKEIVPRTPPADVKTLSPVFVLDPAGDLWLKRDESEAKAGTMEKAAWKDLFAAKNSAASFTLEARTSVMLEKGSEAAFSHLKSDDTYSLALDQGLVMLDTEGSSQKWQISFPNKGKLSFSNLNGRLAVESRGDRMSALLLDGSAEMKFGALAKKAQIGEEIVLPAKDGEQVVEKKVQTQRILARLDELKPKTFTAFAATFDEKSDEAQPYIYGIVTGKRSPGPTGLFLQSETIPAAKQGEKHVLAAEVQLDRAFGVVSGMVLKFRYRTTLPAFTVKIGKYSADVTSRTRAGQWNEAEIPLQAFSFEGTPMLPTDPVENVRFTGFLEKRSSQLDIDGLQFLRRVR